MRYIILILFFLSCNSKDVTDFQKTEADIVIEKSIKLQDSSVVILKLADKKTEMIVQETIEKFHKLEEANDVLKKEMKNIRKTPTVITNTITIRDTIYITEKRNFWGKKKIKIDSSGTEQVITDSTTNEN